MQWISISFSMCVFFFIFWLWHKNRILRVRRNPIFFVCLLLESEKIKKNNKIILSHFTWSQCLLCQMFSSHSHTQCLCIEMNSNHKKLDFVKRIFRRKKENQNKRNSFMRLLPFLFLVRWWCKCDLPVLLLFMQIVKIFSSIFESQ